MEYRTLRIGEVIEDGDEVKSSEGWERSIRIGSKVEESGFGRYRRPLPTDRPITDRNPLDLPTLPDTGERTRFSTGAVRDASEGKGMFSEIPPEALRRLAKRFEDGAKKYSPRNWQKGIPLSRFFDAIIRHTLAANEGKDDEDHLGAVLWNAAAWIWTEDQIKAGKLPAELDDRCYVPDHLRETLSASVCQVSQTPGG